jgi:hypothetical protein
MDRWKLTVGINLVLVAARVCEALDRHDRRTLRPRKDLIA